jgi:hypothetical protein
MRSSGDKDRDKPKRGIGNAQIVGPVNLWGGCRTTENFSGDEIMGTGGRAELMLHDCQWWT